jgi:hypothetical protein
MSDEQAFYCPESGTLYRYIPEGFCSFDSAPLGLRSFSWRAPNSESVMKTTQKISSLELWERQKAVLAKRKQKKAKGGTRSIKLRPNEIAWLRKKCDRVPEQLDFWVKTEGLGDARALPRQCLHKANAAERKRTQPRRLAGGCLLYRLPRSSKKVD